MQTLNAPIYAITVYTDRARVTRRGSVRLSLGEHTVVLTSLPTTIEEDSVRASGQGANVKILGVEVTKHFITQAPETNVAELENRLEDYQEQDRSLIDDDAAQATKLEMLSILRQSSGDNFTKALAYGRSSIDNIQTFLQYLTNELAIVQENRRKIAQQRRVLAKEIEALRAQLAQIKNVEVKERRDIHVGLSVTAETELDLEITYLVRGAAWKPLYDIRLLDSSVSLTYLARISQQSGEDWPAVELLLSTARPAVSATIPELAPWFIDIPRPVTYSEGTLQAMATPQAAPAAMARSVATLAGGPPPPPPKPRAEVAQAEIEQSGATVTYRVKRPVAVPSDGSPHKTTVTTLDFDAQLDYITVPKIAEEAYLRAKIRNTSEFTFLPGPANIFHGSDFVGTTKLLMIAPNQEFEVQLGLDNRIKIERKLIERSTSKALLGSTKKIVFSYKITLTNLLTKPAQITIYDQLPVSKHEQIKVRLQDASPKSSEQSGLSINDLSILKWEMELKPAEKHELTFSFLIEHPRDLTVVGIG
ncbi:MAG: mucoidy inhibitor MuiA family protein [Acidobacteriota bacterium]